MNLAACQVPDKPGIYRAKRQLAALSAGAHALDIIQNPCDLGSREIGIKNKPGTLPNQVLVALCLEPLTRGSCAPALPHDCVAHRPPSCTVPDNRSFPLVCDSNSGDLLRRDASLCDDGPRNGKLRAPDFLGILFDPSGFRIDLCERLRDGSDSHSPVVKQNSPGTRRPLVQRQNIPLHRMFLLQFPAMAQAPRLPLEDCW